MLTFNRNATDYKVCANTEPHLLPQLLADASAQRSITRKSHRLFKNATTGWSGCANGPWISVHFCHCPVFVYISPQIASKSYLQRYSFQGISAMILTAEGTWAWRFGSESEPQPGSPHRSALRHRLIWFPFHHDVCQQWFLEAWSGKQNWKHKNICRWNREPGSLLPTLGNLCMLKNIYLGILN